MSTIVYQGLQSCFESQLIETTTLKLKVAAPRATQFSKNFSIINNQDINKKQPSNLDLGGWNFIQSLSSISSTPKEENDTKIPYVHPSIKKSPKLSQRSLDLCTESLGSESGSDRMDISILSLNSTNPTTEKSKSSSVQKIKSRSKAITRDFPPPLTTISNSNHLQVKPYRENGRLIIKAIKTPPSKTYFHAERCNGRLTLTLINDSVSNLDDSEITNEDNEQINEELNECEINQDNQESHFQEREEQEQEEDQEANDIIKSNDDIIDGNELDAEVGIGSSSSSIEKFQRLRRCKETGHGNKGFCDWKPMWVATS